MINFTIGPVQIDDSILALGNNPVPYFRTQEFSETMRENESLILESIRASEGSRAVFLTGSGTSSMEASIMNTFTAKDRVLVVNGGGFGERFCQICAIHGIPFDSVLLAPGSSLKADDLAPFDGGDYTGFIVNLCETTTGVLYDLPLMSEFCRRNNLIFVVDAVSAYLAEDIDMERDDISVMVTGSQKALALPPGISVVAMSEKAATRIKSNNVSSLYFDLSIALADGERGQTPFTPAVGILLQLNARLKALKEIGFAEETRRIACQAKDFRNRLEKTTLPFTIFAESPANAVTALSTRGVSAYYVFEILKDEYGIWVCPNGGVLRDKVFRVGHLGALTPEDNEVLLQSLLDMQNRGLLKG